MQCFLFSIWPPKMQTQRFPNCWVFLFFCFFSEYCWFKSCHSRTWVLCRCQSASVRKLAQRKPSLLGMKPYEGLLIATSGAETVPLDSILTQNATASVLGSTSKYKETNNTLLETILNPNSMRGLKTPWTLWINLACGYKQWSHKKCFTIINFSDLNEGKCIY